MLGAHEEKVHADRNSVVSDGLQQKVGHDSAFIEVVSKKGKNQKKGMTTGTHDHLTAGTRNTQCASSDKQPIGQYSICENRKQSAQNTELGTES
ncbi:Hypothetical predicted protein, partial [Olea europaea subsp. europaea]